MITPTERLLTAEELLGYPGYERYELVAGIPRVSEPPGGVHGWIATRLAQVLNAHVEAHGLGTVLVESGYIVRRNPDTVRGPDVSFVSRSRLDPRQIPEAFIPFAPDLAIEILSPDDRWASIEEKVADYLSGGTRVVWLVDPGRRAVTVREPDRAPRVIMSPEWLDGAEAIPGFRYGLGDLFGAASTR